MTTSHEDIYLAIGKLQGEMTTMIKVVNGVAEQLDKHTADHSVRIRSLERFRAVAGSIGSLLIVLPGVGWTITKLLN